MRRAATCSAGRRTSAWAGSPTGCAAKQVLILGTQGGIRDEDGTPVALGYHTGHWEIGLLMQAAAEEVRRPGRRSVRRLRQRPVRRPLARNDRHVRFAAVPQ